MGERAIEMNHIQQRKTLMTKQLRLLGLFIFLMALSIPAKVQAAEAPNILWIIVDDMSANFSCYGEKLIETPNVDALAKQGVQFNKAFVTAPVCSTCRSAFITGMYQTSIGAHHHRSGRGKQKIRLPESVELVPTLFQKAGYHTSIQSWPGSRKGRLGKTDYNFEWDASAYDSGTWDDRKPGQPFFAQIQTLGGKMRGSTPEAAEKLIAQAKNTFGNIVDRSQIKLAPYYPQNDVLLQDWAAYLESVRLTDKMVGDVIAKLKRDGDFEKTVIIFMTDHGISHARGKQFLYEEGIHVPLVIAGPGVEHAVRDDLVEHIDIAATSLGLAGIAIPDSMQAKDILAPNYQARDAVFSARDRCDETVEHLRSVRTKRFKYIRNYLNLRSHMQPNAYKDAKAIVKSLRKLHQEGKLNELQSRIFAPTRPPEELYDLEADPHETINLASNPAFAKDLEAMRTRLKKWETDTGDMGVNPEPAEMFDSDMQLYVENLKKRNKSPDHIETMENNIRLMRELAKQGK